MAGTYWNDTQDVCIPCPKGEYQDVVNRDVCVECPPGYTTVATGSDSETDCYGELYCHSLFLMFCSSAVAF